MSADIAGALYGTVSVAEKPFSLPGFTVFPALQRIFRNAETPRKISYYMRSSTKISLLSGALPLPNLPLPFNARRKTQTGSLLPAFPAGLLQSVSTDLIMPRSLHAGFPKSCLSLLKLFSGACRRPRSKRGSERKNERKMPKTQSVFGMGCLLAGSAI